MPLLPLVVPTPVPSLAPVLPLPPVAPIQPVAPVPFANIYVNRPVKSPTSIPEPGTAIALLLIGAGIVCSVKKRNKQVG
ncbi:MAG: PEP-CTERM sorting domain-containing protein [Oscillatoriales cyanobacterium]|nr:MAG: PEP-CTERM sorting domain-containing protein [Oscillatoriales cyanobacterium]TAH23760.1 MAG: PEP-CTERM sorting domain-containing protein [Oscillatoriales cyanobacterium]